MHKQILRCILVDNPDTDSVLFVRAGKSVEKIDVAVGKICGNLAVYAVESRLGNLFVLVVPIYVGCSCRLVDDVTILGAAAGIFSGINQKRALIRKFTILRLKSHLG